MKKLRLHFWLLILGVIAALGRFGSRPYIWVALRAAANDDWGQE